MATRVDNNLAELAGMGPQDRTGTIPGVLVDGPSVRAKVREHHFMSAAKILGSVAAIIWTVLMPTGWTEWSAFLFGYVMLMMGVIIGYHRYFSHNCFETSRPMRYAIGILAQLASHASVMKWASDHRRHHARTDQPGDVHSPYVDGFGNKTGGLKGMYHAHLGWVFEQTTTDKSIYGKGLVDNAVVLFCHRTRYFWFAMSAVILPAIWGFVFGGFTFTHVPGTILIGGFFTVFMVQNAVAGVNSIGHRFGSKRFESRDEARNNWLLAILTLGDGWHNNHHAHPRAAYVGVKWWEVDICGYVILGMEKLGLVWNVKRIKPQL